ncbi:MAG: helix-hairpin-helix domain-containing protein [Rhodanobacteraceae bacterium]
MNLLQKSLAAIAFAIACAVTVPATAAGPVDINSSDAKALAEGMQGVGLNKAEAIVAYRNVHGPFKSADDLAKVKGIGPKTIDKNRDSIVVGKSSAESAADTPDTATPVVGQHRRDGRRPVLRADS